VAGEFQTNVTAVTHRLREEHLTEKQACREDVREELKRIAELKEQRKQFTTSSREVVVDCVMSDWQPKTVCSKSCGAGTQSLKRQVISRPSRGGVRCGKTEREIRCNVHK
jgi:hypothetical protein